MWHPIVIVLGVLTMLVGGWRALRQYDLKLLLAYGTVSQLGFLVLVTGFGTRDAALAGVTLLLAHALFKAALFLVVGIVDHAAGTRDWRKLSGLGRRMPVIATIAIVAAASMAGLPPLLGFVAKEAVFTAFLEAGAAGRRRGRGSPSSARSLGSVLTVAYTVRFVWGAFFTQRGRRAHPAARAEPGASASRPASSPPRASSPRSRSAGIEPLLAAYADELPGPRGVPPRALARPRARPRRSRSWSSPSARCSCGARQRVARLQAAVPARGRLGPRLPRHRVGRRPGRGAVTTAIQHRGLPGYLAIIITVFIGGLGAASVMNTTWPDELRLWDYPAAAVPRASSWRSPPSPRPPCASA